MKNSHVYSRLTSSMKALVLTALALVVVMPFVTPAQVYAAETLEVVGSVAQTGPYGVIVDAPRDRALVANWNARSVSIVDLTDIENPRITNEFIDTSLLNTANDIEIDATARFAYVTTLTTGLVVVDLTTGTATRVGSFTNAGGIDRDGSMIYVAAGSSIESFDISNPSMPVFVASYVFDTAGPLGGSVGAWDLKVSNGTAYVAAFAADRFYTIDVTNTSGGIISSTNNENCGTPGVGCLWTTNFNGALGIALDESGDYAYVLSYGEPTPSTASTNIENDYGAFTVIDITTPTNPIIVAEFTKDVIPAVNGAWDMALQGDEIAITSMNTGLVSRFNISNPLNPTDILTNDESGSGTDIAFYGTALVSLNRSSGGSIDLLDIVDPDDDTTTVSTSGGTSRGALLARMVNRSTLGRRRFEDGLTCPEFTKYMRIGDQTTDVGRMQDVLTVAGFYTGASSMLFDAATFDALKSFQAAKNIRIDGIYGPETHTEASKVCTEFNASLSI